MVNISSIYVHRKSRLPNESEASWKTITNISYEISINASQSIYTISCEAKVKVLNNIYLNQDFCDDFSPKTKMETSYPYIVVVLRRFYLNHFFLDDINATLKLDYNLLKLAVEKTRNWRNLDI